MELAATSVWRRPISKPIVHALFLMPLFGLLLFAAWPVLHSLGVWSVHREVRWNGVDIHMPFAMMARLKLPNVLIAPPLVDVSRKPLRCMESTPISSALISIHCNTSDGVLSVSFFGPEKDHSKAQGILTAVLQHDAKRN